MIDCSTLLIADQAQPARTIHLVDPAVYDDWLKAQPERHRTAIAAQGLKPVSYASAILPGEKADAWSVVSIVENTASLSPWCLAKLAETLPEGIYRVEGIAPSAASLGWLLAQYKFDRYLKNNVPRGPRVLLTSEVAQIDAIVREAEAVMLVRDLVNTPAADMGPGDLEAQAATLTKAYDAKLTVTKGHDLQTSYPMIHAVGAAAAREHAPRLIELEWGNATHPRIAIIGKGVTFDSGGLDIKPSSGMRLMKKDMGGAAHALALVQLIIAAQLPVRLHMLIPAVENAIAGNAFRPGDILTSRKGLTVEIANTDAEGRLVLADALTKAGEGNPTLIIDFATLTGAARVALGPDLPAMFGNNVSLVADLTSAAKAVSDPLWQLPLHSGYDDMLKSDIADLNNAPDGGFAGAITAALFLQKFVSTETPWLHLDTFAWQPAAKPGRPKGGEAIGLRAVWAMLQARFV